MNYYSSLLKKQIKNPFRNQKSPHMAQRIEHSVVRLITKTRKSKQPTEDGTALEKAWQAADRKRKTHGT